MSKEIVLPVLKRKPRATSYKNDSPLEISYIKVTRRISTIEKQIDNLYRKMYKSIHETSIRPTHLVLNETDYAFFKAYHQYVQSTTYYSSPFGERFNTIFGLKVLITQAKRPSVAWEP